MDETYLPSFPIDGSEMVVFLVDSSLYHVVDCVLKFKKVLRNRVLAWFAKR
jgi:hypothetical protein